MPLALAERRLVGVEGADDAMFCYFLVLPGYGDSNESISGHHRIRMYRRDDFLFFFSCARLSASLLFLSLLRAERSDGRAGC